MKDNELWSKLTDIGKRVFVESAIENGMSWEEMDKCFKVESKIIENWYKNYKEDNKNV